MKKNLLYLLAVLLMFGCSALKKKAIEYPLSNQTIMPAEMPAEMESEQTIIPASAESEHESLVSTTPAFFSKHEPILRPVIKSIDKVIPIDPITTHHVEPEYPQAIEFLVYEQPEKELSELKKGLIGGLLALLLIIGVCITRAASRKK